MSPYLAAALLAVGAVHIFVLALAAAASDSPIQPQDQVTPAQQGPGVSATALPDSGPAAPLAAGPHPTPKGTA